MSAAQGSVPISDLQLSRSFSHLATPLHTPVDPRYTREFTGNGSAYLPVKGLKEIKEVSTDGIVIPLEHTQRVVTDRNGNTSQETVPLIGVMAGSDGPVLVRGIQSNNGIWQRGARFLVTGVWDDDTATPTEPEPVKTEPVKPEAPKPQTPATPAAPASTTPAPTPVAPAPIVPPVK